MKLGCAFALGISPIFGCSPHLVNTSALTSSADIPLTRIFRLYFNVWGTDASQRSYVARATLNMDTMTAMVDKKTELASYFGNTNIIRGGLAFCANGEILVGSAGHSKLIRLDKELNVLGEITISGGSVGGAVAPDLSGEPLSILSAHTMCVLPNGNWVLGRYGDEGQGAGYNGPLQEYSSSGEAIRRLGWAIASPAGALGQCLAPSSERLYWVDYGASGEVGGGIVISENAGGTGPWVEKARLHYSAGLPVSQRRSLYGLALHPDGNLYVFPQNLGLANRKVIRCQNIAAVMDSAGLSSACAEVGEDLSTYGVDTTGGPDGQYRLLMGSTLLPNRQEIAFLNSAGKLFLYTPGSNSGDIAEEVTFVTDFISAQENPLTDVYGIMGLLAEAIE